MFTYILIYSSIFIYFKNLLQFEQAQLFDGQWVAPLLTDAKPGLWHQLNAFAALAWTRAVSSGKIAQQEIGKNFKLRVNFSPVSIILLKQETHQNVFVLSHILLFNKLKTDVHKTWPLCYL